VLSYTGEPLTTPLTIAWMPSTEAHLGADRDRHLLVAALVAVDETGEPRCISVGASRIDHTSPTLATQIPNRTQPDRLDVHRRNSTKDSTSAPTGSRT
jgi:predicted acyl esterase